MCGSCRNTISIGIVSIPGTDCRRRRQTILQTRSVGSVQADVHTSRSLICAMSSEQGKADLYSSDSAEDSERERMHRTNKGRLGKMARRRLEAGLRAMTGEREQIARLMEFAVNHADAVDDVSDKGRIADRGRSDRADQSVMN
jgi:hypothetical protein